MKITDEMIEAGCKARYLRWEYLSEEHRVQPIKRMRAVLEAALSASPAGVVKPKPLEWRDKSIGVYRRDRAKTSIGTYSAWRDGSLYYNEERIKICADFEAAKSAAFADYSARIMSAIEPAGVGVEKTDDGAILLEKLKVMRGIYAMRGEEYTSRAFHNTITEFEASRASLKGDEQ